MRKNLNEATLWSKYIYEWIDCYAPSICGNSVHTIKTYRLTLSLYVHFLITQKGVGVGNFKADIFCKSNIEEWILWLQNKRSNSYETCNNRLAALRTFLKFVSEKNICYAYLYNQARLIPYSKTQKKKVEGMSKKATATLISTPNLKTKTGRRDHVLMILMYATAARINEILSIKIEDIHIEVDKPYITVVGKGGKIRTLYLLPKAISHLKAYIREFHGVKSPNEAYLFYSRNHGIYGKLSDVAVNKQLKKHADAARLSCKEVPDNMHAHIFRHAKATHWMDDGMQIVQISYLLGHSNLNTTMKYLDITTEQEIRALETLHDEGSNKIKRNWKGQVDDLVDKMGLISIK